MSEELSAPSSFEFAETVAHTQLGACSCAASAFFTNSGKVLA